MMKWLALLPALGLAQQTNEFHALIDVDLGAAFDVSLGTQGFASALEMGAVPLCAVNKTATAACLGGWAGAAPLVLARRAKRRW